MSIVSPKGVVGRAKAGWTSYRAGHPWLEHVLAAYSRMNRSNANQYAAAITYFSFLALFPLLLLAVAVVGYVLFFEPHLQTELFSKITDQVPGTLGSTLKSAVSEAIEHRNSVGVIGVLGVLLTGLGWIGNLRQSIDAVWGQQAPKRNFLSSRTTNLGVLAGLGLGVVVSVGLTAAGTSVTTQILDAVSLESVPGATVLLKVIGIAIAAAGDMIVFWWLLVRLPAVHLERRIMLKGVLMASIGFEILKIVGTYTVAHAVQSATAGPFALPVALLVWIQLVCRFMLFCCSWMAVLRDDAARVAEVDAIIEPPAVASPAAVAHDQAGDRGGDPSRSRRGGRSGRRHLGRGLADTCPTQAADSETVIISRRVAWFLIAFAVWSWVIWPTFLKNIWADPRSWRHGMTAFFAVHLVLTIVSLTLGTIIGGLGVRALRTRPGTIDAVAADRSVDEVRR